MIDPTKDEIKNVSDLYLPFGTEDHIEILNRCINIFDILINYHKEINQYDFRPQFRQILSEAKKLAEERESQEQIDETILLLTKQMRELRETSVFEDDIKNKGFDAQFKDEDEFEDEY